VLTAFPDTPLNIEIKQRDPAIEPVVAALLDRFGARSRVLLAAEHVDIMVRIRQVAPDIVTSFAATEVAEFVIRLRDGNLAGYRPAGIALQVPPAFDQIPIVTVQSVAAAHDLGLEVHVWTINEEAEMERLLDLGVDGLMSDFPARGYAVLRRRGSRS
jgi:glycerophosphoryl diester phosphodiesterase